MLTHMPQQFRGNNRLQQRSSLHSNANGVEDVFAWCALEQVAIGSGFKRGDDALVVIESGKADNARVACISSTRVKVDLLAQAAICLASIHDRHFELK